MPWMVWGGEDWASNVIKILFYKKNTFRLKSVFKEKLNV